MGLHNRYEALLNGEHHCALSAKKIEPKQQEQLRAAFKSMMKGLFRQKGASLDINIITSKEAQAFIETHADVLNSAFEQTKMSATMRDSLEHSTYIFSGLKTFHELNEAFPALIDENGNRKSFERFLNDVQKLDKTYNEHYLRAEYNFAHASAMMAAKWEAFAEDGDRYNLQYRTVGDDHVRPEHAALNGTTLPFSDAFWDSYYPPNGWNCRCTVVQVRKTKYPETPREEAYRRGAEALANDTRGMFRFNPGKQGKAIPDYNPYSIRRCNDCDLAKGKANLAFVPENELCAACRLVRQCEANRYEVKKEYANGGKVQVHQLVNPHDSDYGKLMSVADFFAQQGADVKLTPKMSRPPKFVYQNIYHSLMGTKFEGKCPDMLIDGKWYEHEGFTSDNPKRAFKNMLNDGLKQSNRLIIDQPQLTDRYMVHNIWKRIHVDRQDIIEIWIKDGDNLRCIYKKTDG